MSPLLANIALSVLDEHLHAPWLPGGAMSTAARRHAAPFQGLPTWRIVRYADDFVVLVHGCENDAQALREDIAGCSHRWGCACQQPRPRCVHMSDGFEFLGFRIQWRRKAGTNKWYVYTFIADRPVKVAEGEDPCPDPQDITGGPEGDADPAQPDPARLGRPTSGMPSASTPCDT